MSDGMDPKQYSWGGETKTASKQLAEKALVLCAKVKAWEDPYKPLQERIELERLAREYV